MKSADMMDLQDEQSESSKQKLSTTMKAGITTQ